MKNRARRKKSGGEGKWKEEGKREKQEMRRGT
jgi:hypothetical protein